MNKTIGELLENAKEMNSDELITEINSQRAKKQSDKVTHPSHYMMGSKETIEIIKDITDKEFGSYCVGNVIKYLSRYKYKNGIEDLKKAQQYIQFMIDDLEKGEKE